MKKIKWIDIKGYEGIYKISNTGSIRSIYRGRNTGRILIPILSTGGYYQVNLGSGDSKKKCLIHRLVAQSFLKNKKYKEVNHKDGIKSNNNISNLEWCDRSQNMKHSIENGLLILNRNKTGQFIS